MELSIKFRIPKYGSDLNSFLANDILSLVEDSGRPELGNFVVEITDLFVSRPLRRKRLGTQLIKTIMREYPEHIYLIAGSISKKEFKIEPTAKVIKKHFAKLDKFFGSLGFVSINDFVQYENKRAYLFIGDHKGKTVNKLIQNRIYGEKNIPTVETGNDLFSDASFEQDELLLNAEG